MLTGSKLLQFCIQVLRDDQAIPFQVERTDWGWTLLAKFLVGSLRPWANPLRFWICCHSFLPFVRTNSCAKHR